ncbi:MAG: LPS export ABC transporter periplasmic protein LptC [Gammaproteobacteria bacterium]|nr:MAG: LPS export ABC transporter periplasmic protein LptC [Gammaproteobacteria bacterium]TLY88625.1 MAG: LPS export ABC transporter periplasmic protein LptC [Gammaproteobacteria bacterium]
MTYRLLAILALVALVVGVVVLSGPQRESAAPSTVGPLHDPGYAARRARLIQTGSDGRPLYILDAAQIQQQPNQGTVDLQQVQLGFRDTSGTEWSARADRGQLTQESGVVQLEGGVRVVGSLPDTGEPAEISTERLSFDTQSQIVTTRDPVTLLVSGRALQAQGLIASLKERHVQLESAVHGSFLP